MNIRQIGKSNNYISFGNGVETRMSIMAAWDDGSTGFSLGTNFWSGKFKQQTGIMGFRSGDFRFSYENDGGPPFKWFGNSIVGNTDQNRTAALQFSIKDFSLNIKFFTGIPDEGNIDYSNPKAKYGTYNNPEADMYRLGAITIGYKGYQIGRHDEIYRVFGQNILTHNNTGDPWFRGLYNKFPAYNFFQYQSPNPYTRW